MRCTTILFAFALAALAQHATARPTPLGSAFTYQGVLKAGGNAYNGTADFQFRLYDAASGSGQVGAMLPMSGLIVTDGTFTTSLDFGMLAFNGQERWLEIDVRTPAGSGAFNTLTPRQRLAAAPYALRALSASVSGVQSSQVSFDNVANAFTGSSLAIDNGTLLVDSVGNRVGIGTPAPAATLHVVKGDSNEVADDNSSLVIEGSGPNYLSILSGNLGEGGVLFGDPFNPYAKNGMVFNSPTNFMGLDFRVYGGQTAMSIDYIARVGIGTTTPSAKLDVNGTVRATALEIPTTTRNLSIPATATFHSTDASFARTYSAIFSASPAGQNVALYAPVNLPDGAIVTAFRVECLDNDPAHDLYVNLYQTAGDNATYMAQVNTSGASSGTQTMLDSTINLAWIDNAQYGYVIGAFWPTPATFGAIKLFRFVVTYTITSPLP